MAVAQPLLLVPIKLTQQGHVNLKQQQPLDVTLLCSKLEDHKRKLDAARSKREQSDIVPRLPYVPRTAADHFAATTVPVNDFSRRQPGGVSSTTTKAKAKAKSKSKSKPAFTADGKPCVSPMQLHAALSLGTPEAEIAPTLIDARGCASQLSNKAKRKCNEEGRDGSRPPTLDKVVGKAPIYGDQPGDAAKRNAKNQWTPLVAVKPGSMTTFERIHSGAGDDVPKLNVLDALAERAHLRLLDRPKMQPHDRPNWAQESQCGEDMRHLLHDLPIRPKQKRVQQVDIPHSTACVDTLGRRPQITRHENPGDAQDKLVSDAVARIKQEEKTKLRQNLADLFKRF